MAAREPTERQLADLVRHLARLCLETERGLRPPVQLTRFMNPDAALRAAQLVRLGRFEAGPVQPADIGPAHVTRHADGTVFASVVTHTEGRRWGALTFQLMAREGRLQIVNIGRLLAASRQVPDRTRPLEPPMTPSRSRNR